MTSKKVTLKNMKCIIMFLDNSFLLLSISYLFLSLSYGVVGVVGGV